MTEIEELKLRIVALERVLSGFRDVCEKNDILPGTVKLIEDILDGRRIPQAAVDVARTRIMILDFLDYANINNKEEKWLLEEWLKDAVEKKKTF